MSSNFIRIYVNLYIIFLRDYMFKKDLLRARATYDFVNILTANNQHVFCRNICLFRGAIYIIPFYIISIIFFQINFYGINFYFVA